MLKKELRFNSSAPDFFLALAPSKAKKFKELHEALYVYLLTDLRLGQTKKIVSTQEFFKSGAFKKIDLDIESEEEFLLTGFLLGLVTLAIQQQIIAQEGQAGQIKQRRVN